MKFMIDMKISRMFMSLSLSRFQVYWHFRRHWWNISRVTTSSTIRQHNRISRFNQLIIYRAYSEAGNSKSHTTNTISSIFLHSFRWYYSLHQIHDEISPRCIIAYAGWYRSLLSRLDQQLSAHNFDRYRRFFIPQTCADSYTKLTCAWIFFQFETKLEFIHAIILARCTRHT